jgi:hypothetical protein
MKKRRIAIIGGGPAGMMAAIAAASVDSATSVILLEKNEKLGKKLHLTGKGRCNITNATDVENLMAHVPRNASFLHSSFSKLDAAALMAFIEGIGVPLKTERGNRVFPVSDKANDINQALAAQLGKLGVKVVLHCAVQGVECDELFRIHTNKGTMDANALIIATGGLSYPSTGATGEGYTFAKKLGHSIKATFPSLVPLLSDEPWIPALEGLSLKNVRLTAYIPHDKKVLYEETGEMLFTAEGVSGPLVLRASSYMAHRMGDKPALILDLKPGLTHEQLDARILRDFAEHQNKDFVNALDDLLPQRMINIIVEMCGIPPEAKVNAITRAQRENLVQILKTIPINITATAGYKEAVITRGGVYVSELSPSTLMSKKIRGLFFAGECLDVDALTGGYNLQIAFSTGHLAGTSAGMLMSKNENSLNTKGLYR